MANYLSAGVYSTEVDLSVSVPSVSTGIAAYAGEFTKGPVSYRRLITSIDEFVHVFGTPIETNYNDWYQVSNFLKYGNQIYVVRSVGLGCTNGGSVIKYDSGTSTQSVVTVSTPTYDINNSTEFEFKKTDILTSFAAIDVLHVIRKDKGLTPDTIKFALSATPSVALSLSSETVLDEEFTTGVDFSNVYGYTLDPNERVFVTIVNDVITETFLVSLDKDGTDDEGNSIFIDDVLFSKSGYLYSVTDTEYTHQIGYDTIAKISATAVGNGIYVTPTIGNLQLSYDLFAQVDDFDCSILIGNEKINIYVADIAKTRADVIAILGVNKDSCVNHINPIQGILDYIKNNLNIENSYAAVYGNYIKIYDKYNDKFRWVNMAGAIAGSQVRTNNSKDVWWANAGMDRGQLDGVSALAFNPNQGLRDSLYNNKVNPIVSFPGQGNCIIWGQKTMLSRPSAFNRINVRQLFLVIEKSVNKVMKYFIFEPNDVFTRAQITSMIKPFLEDIKGRRGVYDYLVVCNEQNNTAEVIDRNELKVDILLKPTKTAEFISVRYVATKTGVDLEEIAKSMG